MKVTQAFRHDTVNGFKFGYHPFSKPQLYVHIYYIDGLLIDTGQSRMRKEVLEITDSLSISNIFVTHYHEDHTGNLTPLLQRLNCPAYSSSLCKELMKAPPDISFAQKIFWGEREAYSQLEAKEGILETDKYCFKLIPIPGHSIDMIALYEAKEGWLFSADLYVNNYIIYMLPEESIKEQIESISNILKLDFELLFCSHNPQFTDGKKRLAEKHQFLSDFYGKVAAEYHKGKAAKEILHDLALKEKWMVRLLSNGALSQLNMVKSVIRDEKQLVAV